MVDKKSAVDHTGLYLCNNSYINISKCVSIKKDVTGVKHAFDIIFITCIRFKFNREHTGRNKTRPRAAYNC